MKKLLGVFFAAMLTLALPAMAFAAPGASQSQGSTSGNWDGVDWTITQPGNTTTDNVGKVEFTPAGQDESEATVAIQDAFGNVTLVKTFTYDIQA